MRSVNVRDYGAVGDGVTDDTAAFQRAVDALRVPPRATLRARVLLRKRGWRVAARLRLARLYLWQIVVGLEDPEDAR